MNYKNLADVPGIKKIIPQMFVWHVTLRENRESILKYGLRTDKSEHNCIFANNLGKKIKLFYPFCIERYDGSFREGNLIKYDYWRIDTTLIDVEWYIDPNMRNGPKEFMENEQDYIVTDCRIPKYAIDLFEVPPFFYHKTVSVLILCKEKTTGIKHRIPLKAKENIEIKKEIKAYRKEFYIINIETKRTVYIIDDDKFPLLAPTKYI